MAIRDAHLMYSDAQVLAASGASSNIVDHGSDRNLGIGEPMCIVLNLPSAPDSADGDETYTAKLETDSDSAFGSAAQVGATATITRSDPAGSQYVIVIPPDTAIKRYTRVYYTLGGTSPSLTVDAFMAPLSQVQSPNAGMFYPRGYTITS